MVRTSSQSAESDLEQGLLADFLNRGTLDELLPQLARDRRAIQEIESVVRSLTTEHDLVLGDARSASALPPDSVHLVVTSPPYWTLKRYHEHDGQLGHVPDYEAFHASLEEVWRNCFRALVPGGVSSSMPAMSASGGGRTTAGTPLPRSTRRSRNGARRSDSITWRPSSGTRSPTRTTRSPGAGGGLGKPYEPNAVIKNDIEFVLMQRKPGGYRSPKPRERLLSLISAENYQAWFRQIWSDIRETSAPSHPAPFPIEFAERLVRMFSFVGDTVLDPFMGTGTTSLACARWGRNSIGIESDPRYYEIARKRVADYGADLYVKTRLTSRVLAHAKS